ncbi:MAG: 23S rRNA (uracil(1939)-C(5))-methyltransferase RlmD, partial [Clostridia bacterium]|nr:23S rRNA (uracil(1939)-C(5))-methyltransferase RlmD [Clostridia bacterium]
MDLQKNDKIEVTIESLGYKGEGVARIDRVPVFINGALPGERVRAHIILVKSSYAVAKLLEVLSPSDKRVQPECKYFGKCGGCNVQHMEREAQLEFKKGLVEDALHKIARMEAEVQPTQASEKQYGYRNKLSLPVRKSREGTAVGLFAYNSHRVVEIDDCPLQSEGVRGLIPKLHKLSKYFPPYDEESGKGVLRHFVARDLGGKLSLTVVATRDVSEKLKSIASEIGLGVDELWLNINRQKNNVIMGDETILIDGAQVEVDVLGLTTTVHPQGFMQVNDGVMKKLYTAVLDKAKELAPDLIIDAYSGGGTLTALLSRVGKKVIGVEIEQAAVDSANALMHKQGITNVTNYCADCAQLLPILLGSKNSELVEGSQEESHFGKEYRHPEQEYRP